MNPKHEARYELTVATRRSADHVYFSSALLARLFAKILWLVYLGQHDIQIRDLWTGRYVRE